MEDMDRSNKGQSLLARLRSGKLPSDWQVFRISRKKLALLSLSFCAFVSVLPGLLALYTKL